MYKFMVLGKNVQSLGFLRYTQRSSTTDILCWFSADWQFLCLLTNWCHLEPGLEIQSFGLLIFWTFRSLKKIDNDQIALINLVRRLIVSESIPSIFKKDRRERFNLFHDRINLSITKNERTLIFYPSKPKRKIAF